MDRRLVEACELLGVPVGSRQAVLSQAYRQLARTTHPDVSEDPDASERFMRIKAAFDLASASAPPSLSTAESEQDLIQVNRSRTTSRHFDLSYRHVANPRPPTFVAGPVSVEPPTGDNGIG